uniref:Uncharacterized protein n=1 Tax=Arundo donax TaxID=35708 RepID=A0A0A9F3B2_ARUDO
MQPVGRGQ